MIDDKKRIRLEFDVQVENGDYDALKEILEQKPEYFQGYYVADEVMRLIRTHALPTESKYSLS